MGKFKILIFLCILFGSCRTQQWYGKQITIANYKYPGLTSGFCAGAFPIKSDTSLKYISITDTIIQPGETILVDCDSISAGAQTGAALKSNKVSVKCPPSTIIHTRDTITITINKENTARIEALKIENKGAFSSVNSWRNAAFIFGVLFIVSLLIIFLTLKRMK